MSSDINIILQLLQRQLSQVPPAYSPISPSSHNLAMYGIIPRSLEPLTPCAPLEDEQRMAPGQVRSPLMASFCPQMMGPGVPVVLSSLPVCKAQLSSFGSRQSPGVLKQEVCLEMLLPSPSLIYAHRLPSQ